MPRESTIRACLTIKSSQLRALKGLSRETGAPVAELTRRAVDAFLASRVPGYIPGSQHPGPDLCETGPLAAPTHS